MPTPTADKLIECMAEYIARHRITKRAKTHPGTAFNAEKFKQIA